MRGVRAARQAGDLAHPRREMRRIEVRCALGHTQGALIGDELIDAESGARIELEGSRIPVTHAKGRDRGPRGPR